MSGFDLFLAGWAVAALLMLVAWIVQWRARDAGVVDFTWAAGLGVLASGYALLADGDPGSAGLRFDAGNVLSGSGGRSHFGGGARGNVGALAGTAAATRGAGGAGGAAASSTTGFAGGAGAAGLVMLWEFE